MASANHEDFSSSSSSSPSEGLQDFTHEDTEWQDVDEEQGDDVSFVGLFDGQRYSSMEEMLQQTKEHSGLDVRRTIQQLGGYVDLQLQRCVVRLVLWSIAAATR